MLYAGSLGIRKGIPYLLQAFQKLPYPHKKLRLAGSVSEEMKAILPTLPTDGVEFLGPLPQGELISWMQRSHLLVLPSIEDGFGMVLAQALACGCPILCSQNTGGPDLVQDGREGFIVPIRDVNSLVDRMDRLAQDRILWSEMREAGLRRVATLGGWKDYGDKWVEVLQNLIDTDNTQSNR
ncbi:glycosyltransferase family 4 protein [Granulicella cerasi]|uniref:Glycosyltransferase family 4 protein n=1 Tax=Granulicella cerasi TaxID=741063 RepID=A0ABW1Z4A7_9BACT